MSKPSGMTSLLTCWCCIAISLELGVVDVVDVVELALAAIRLAHF
jgi:hypothetical protein